MNILITGGAGFIGSHLAEAHIARGDTVTILDDFSTGNEDNLRKLRKLANVVKGDARLPSMIEKHTRGIDGIYHLAAVVGVKRYLQDPAGCLHANLDGTEAVCEFAKQRKIKLVFASSSEVYGMPGKDPIEEDTPCVIGTGPRWSYAASKLAGEYMVQGVADSGTPAVSVRLFNVIGPRQGAGGGAVLPALLNEIRQGKPKLKVFGDGEQRRTFCYVGDTVAALVGLMDAKKATSGAYNLGGEIECSINHLADAVIAAVKPNLKEEKNVVQHVPYEKAYPKGAVDDPRQRVPDCTKLHDLTGWKPKVGLEAAIKAAMNGLLAPAKSGA